MESLTECHSKDTVRLPRFERAIRCLLAIQRGEQVSAMWMVEKLGISYPQAKRDMLELECALPLRRTRRGNRIILEFT
jgi:hypothetical protein